jgi:DNA-binding HxlR family transcriptional regulator
MNIKEKQIERKLPPQDSARMVETIYGCKWSLTVYQLLANGVNRPGEMVRSVEGLSTKVLNQCLKRNLDFGILKKQVYHELPPRVEYEVTPFGERFLSVLEQIEALQEDLTDTAEN